VTVRLAAAKGSSTSFEEGDREKARLSCAFVNNMPDGSFDATERQFLGLLDAGSGADVIEVRRYAMDGIPRQDQTAKRIAEEYLSWTNIRESPPDVLVVTGSNPIELQIEDEPYWDDLAQLLSWARTNVRSMLLSCLSAHAALAIFDGIGRVHLLAKCTGVFPQDVEVDHQLTEGIDPNILLPHSRWNSAPGVALEDTGYDLLIRSEITDWGAAVRNEDGHQLVLVQGHPEYDPSSLLREYRRDAGRYVRHEREDLPFLPYHCVSSDDWEVLERMHRQIIDGDRDPELLEHYPFDEVGARAPWAWHEVAERFYTNWLSSVTRGEG
jgi:homoserine O-succinyltransferase/O-acetyltransferase